MDHDFIWISDEGQDDETDETQQELGELRKAMGRGAHTLRLALGRSADRPPDWTSLCPPYVRADYEVDMTVMPGPALINTFRVEKSQTVAELLPTVLRLWASDGRIDGPPEAYQLYIVYAHEERLLESHEKALQIFQTMRDGGLKPIFMLKKRSDNVVTKPSPASTGFADGKETRATTSSVTDEAPLPQPERSRPGYILCSAANKEPERYSMSYNRTYDAKGRPMSVAKASNSRQIIEQQMVEAQNSVLVTGARTLAQGRSQDDNAADAVSETDSGSRGP